MKALESVRRRFSRKRAETMPPTHPEPMPPPPPPNNNADDLYTSQKQVEQWNRICEKFRARAEASPRGTENTGTTGDPLSSRTVQNEMTLSDLVIVRSEPVYVPVEPLHSDISFGGTPSSDSLGFDDVFHAPRNRRSYSTGSLHSSSASTATGSRTNALRRRSPPMVGPCESDAQTYALQESDKMHGYLATSQEQRDALRRISLRAPKQPSMFLDALPERDCF